MDGILDVPGDFDGIRDAPVGLVGVTADGFFVAPVVFVTEGFVTAPVVGRLLSVGLTLEVTGSLAKDEEEEREW